MQIRRNTKSFKTILGIVTTCHTRPDRRELVRLYITKAGTSIKEGIPVEAIQGDTEFFYDLNYQSVLNNLNASTHQLHQSDDTPGIYFFHSLSKDWDETPFEFDPKVKEIFSSLPELPAVRERSAPKEFVSPTQSTPTPKKQKEQKQPTIVKQPIMVVNRGPKQPDYKLKHEIIFTDLDKVVFRQENLDKKDVLDHYNKIAEYLLPYLKDRPHLVKQQNDSGPNVPRKNIGSLPNRSRLDVPHWVDADQFLSNDKEHLLYCVEAGCVEFDPLTTRKRSPGSPDHLVIGVDSGSEFGKAIEAANVLHEVLEGLYLPSFVKTDGVSGFHVYIPLDPGGSFGTTASLAEFICKLVRLKVPGLVALEGSAENSYGKVTLDHLLNNEGVGVVAPYSLVAGSPANVATPLGWDEVREGLRMDDFNHKTIFDRLKKVGDPFEGMMKKKVNAEEVLTRLEENYLFLL
jgi:DNA ligase D-like protein (predicted polymerase)